MNLANIHQTKPLTKFERNKIENVMARRLKQDSGSHQPFRLKVGDIVEDFGSCVDGHANPAGTVVSCYRENGHNRIETETRFYREQDLRKVGI